MINTVFWDFDGVLMDSNLVRDEGFLAVLKGYPQDQIDKLLVFHQENGGLSRYVKFRYFFENIRGESITESEVQQWAEKFSVIMKKMLTNPSLIIEDTINFVKNNFVNYQMHIVSGSDGNELNFLCKKLGISDYFISIHGSPTPKLQLVADIIKKYQYDLNSCVLIGDSINDYEAALGNKINFVAYNNSLLSDLNTLKFEII
jgi:phosphoglycolate phosphatase-like HAD superfamily hydrolase